MRFEIGREDFLLDGEPVRVLSGALHYFRIHPDQWRDRIRRGKELGLNTIETYVPWNAHSPEPGVFGAEGALDLGRFLDEVAAEGMWAIVRPGPYICAEWSNGGLPPWLLREEIALRSCDPAFLDAVRKYLSAVSTIVAPRQIEHGGPVVLVQVENEYGAYGQDKAYLRALVQMLRDHGIVVPLTTVDQPEPEMLERGSLPGVHVTGSFGSRSEERLSTLRRFQPEGPLMCSEFWDGWFDSWGRHHHTTNAKESARELDALLAAGASVNLYMLCGGTNFGFTNGANHKGAYVPISTTYDYDAPLDEAGNPTEKYWAFRRVLSKYVELPDLRPTQISDSPEFGAPLRASVPLSEVTDLLGVEREFDHVPTMDELGQASGLAVYRCLEAVTAAVLEVREVRDRAQVFVSGIPVGVLNRDLGERWLAVPDAAPGELELLVEDLGRVDYGARIGEAKGLIGPVRAGDRQVGTWAVRPMPLDDVEEVATLLRRAPAAAEVRVAGPAFALAEFETPRPDLDHYLDTSGWGKGVAWVNGFNVGRFWSRGPQRTLYVPAPLMRPQGNEVVVLLLDGGTAEVRFAAGPDLGPSEE